MTINFPGPYQVRIKYEVLGRVHVQRLNCIVSGTPDPGDDASTISLTTKSGGTVSLTDAIDDWVALMAPFLASAAGSFSVAELWKYATASNNADYVTTYVLGVPGTGGGTTVNASQCIWSGRTANGGAIRIEMLDTQITAGEPDLVPFTLVTNQDIEAYILDDANWIYGKDNSYPVALVGFYPGQSEYWFKKITGR